VTKAHILDEIRRAATANGGVPLGEARFEAETGIKRSDWFGLHWARWGDALREAGFPPNQLKTAFGEETLLDNYARYAKELHRLPTSGDLRMKRRTDDEFPSWNTFARLGAKRELVRKLLEYCRSAPDLGDVIPLCEEYLQSDEPADSEEAPQVDEDAIGYVYLIKSGRFYKIGKSNSAGRRGYEVALQLPERAETVHVIRTDDPTGIEDYWHRRFAAKRMNGEWFSLSGSDVAAFRRRKFM
jgi:hypothetical protein